jgi:Peptidase_C39 like family
MLLSSSPDPSPILLDVPRFEQPDDVTCGPTCLTQVFRFFGYAKTLPDVIAETPRNPDGGTLAVYLGIGALANGFRPTIYPYSLRVFDPTWRDLSRTRIIDKLRQRKTRMDSYKLRRAIDAYVTYLEDGGQLLFDELTRDLLVGLLRGGQPILTGLSATYLYRTPREYDNQYDDIRGQPAGHFVVICGYYPKSDKFVIRDPSTHSPFSRSGKYSVPAERLIPAILLGDVTYDAVLLVLSPR